MVDCQVAGPSRGRDLMVQNPLYDLFTATAGGFADGILPWPACIIIELGQHVGDNLARGSFCQKVLANDMQRLRLNCLCRLLHASDNHVQGGRAVYFSTGLGTGSKREEK